MFSAALISEADKSFGFVIFVIFRSLVDFLTLLINRKTYAVTRKRRVKVQKFSQFILFAMSGGFGLEPFVTKECVTAGCFLTTSFNAVSGSSDEHFGHSSSDF
jgi:hypothetical protein